MSGKDILYLKKTVLVGEQVIWDFHPAHLKRIPNSILSTKLKKKLCLLAPN